ncbi:MAG: alpha/beta hydrolase [Desulfobacterales bacterium]|nr:alpha/beta hydrolase [Desulfobacterales bacterium]
MPYFNRGNARIYYEDKGAGEPVIAVAGLMENTAYWDLTGVADAISRHFRFVSMDLRGHGYTEVEGDPPGFDCQTVGEDIIAMADHLGMDRFHLLTHSTGGFAGVRHAMKDCSRFASLILTNTASFTSPVPGDQQAIDQFHDNFATLFEKLDWETMIARLKQKPGPFFRGIVESENADEMLGTALSMAKRNNRFVIADFVRSFYKDPDSRVEGLRRISCPVLIVGAQKDDLFVESSRLMAKEIPGAQLLEYEGIGHMTAIEAPQRLASDVLDFLRSLN